MNVTPEVKLKIYSSSTLDRDSVHGVKMQIMFRGHLGARGPNGRDPCNRMLWFLFKYYSDTFVA
jgi:hypothetical protein